MMNNEPLFGDGKEKKYGNDHDQKGGGKYTNFLFTDVKNSVKKNYSRFSRERYIPKDKGTILELCHMKRSETEERQWAHFFLFFAHRVSVAIFLQIGCSFLSLGWCTCNCVLSHSAGASRRYTALNKFLLLKYFFPFLQWKETYVIAVYVNLVKSPYLSLQLQYNTGFNALKNWVRLRMCIFSMCIFVPGGLLIFENDSFFHIAKRIIIVTSNPFVRVFLCLQFCLLFVWCVKRGLFVCSPRFSWMKMETRKNILSSRISTNKLYLKYVWHIFFMLFSTTGQETESDFSFV